jgi:hypothetical protein
VGRCTARAAAAFHVGERAGNNANDCWTSSDTVANAFLRWEYPVLGQKTRLQLNVDNLFDKQYYPSSTGGELQVNAGEARTARVSASATLLRVRLVPARHSAGLANQLSAMRWYSPVALVRCSH